MVVVSQNLDTHLNNQEINERMILNFIKKSQNYA
jgi:hypothetical protein